MKYLLIYFISLLGFAQDFSSLNSKNVLEKVISKSSSENTISSTVIQYGYGNQALIKSGYQNILVSQFGNSNQIMMNTETLNNSFININMIGHSNEIIVQGINNISKQMSIELMGNHRTIHIHNTR